jgi:TRAP-type C4-dicarboxylate transport system permease small subunit
MAFVFKFRSTLEKIILSLAASLLALVAILIAMQILLRTLGVGVDWTEEFSRFSYVGVTFLGSILAITQGRHITITFLVDLLPFPVRRAVGVIVHFIMAFFMGVCVYGTTLLMAAARGVGSNSMSWFMLNYLYALVLVSCALMLLFSLIRAVEIAGQKTPGGTGAGDGAGTPGGPREAVL